MSTKLFRFFQATATTAIALGCLATEGWAVSLVPETEGEIELQQGCLDADQCLSLDSFDLIDSIVPLTDSTTNTISRLFVDDSSTANEYGPIRFKDKDAGTNPLGFIFRPSAYDPDAGVTPERGQLEVGTYEINFSTLLSELEISYVDVESENTTGVIAINGMDVGSPDWVPPGADGNIFTQTFQDVSSITLKLGQYDPTGIFGRAPGDGASFLLAGTPANATSVPEPATVFGLGMIGLAFVRHQLRNRC